MAGHRFNASSVTLYSAIVAQTALSTGTFLAAKRALQEFAPFSLLVHRFIFSGLLFTLLLVLLPGKALPPRRAILPLLALGAISGPVNQGLMLFGLSRSLPAHAALIYSLAPVGVYLVSVGRGHERLRWSAAAGSLVAALGVLVLLGREGFDLSEGPLVGDLFLLLGMTAAVFHVVEGKRMAVKYGPFRSTAWIMISGALVVCVFAPWLLGNELATASSVAIGSLVYLSVLTSVVTMLLVFYALSRAETSRVIIFSNLPPVLTAVFAWAVFDDPITWAMVIGGALVLGGMSLTLQKATVPV